MSLIRETEYGKIIISDELFRDGIESACSIPECNRYIWLANKPNIEAGYGEDGRITLEFSVIVKFGSPIKKLCKLVADNVSEQIKERSGKLPLYINVKVVGVKSKNVVKRSMEVLCEF